MRGLRSDIAAAVSRMQLTFGSRSAIKNLHESLEDGEVVVAMVACTYDRSEGLLVLTNSRVMAVRDDFSRFRLQTVPVHDVRGLDYAPQEHDGLAVATDTGRIAVRRMFRVDSDVFVAALRERVPALQSDPVDLFAAGADADQPAEQGWISSSEQDHEAAVPTITTVPTDPTMPATPPAPTMTNLTAASAASAIPLAGQDGAIAADTETLLGVLADLHAKGLLTSDELTAKITQLTTSF